MKEVASLSLLSHVLVQIRVEGDLELRDTQPDVQQVREVRAGSSTGCGEAAHRVLVSPSELERHTEVLRDTDERVRVGGLFRECESFPHEIDALKKLTMLYLHLGSAKLEFGGDAVRRR